MTKRRKFWTFRAAADETSVGELLLYGPISDFSWWGDEVTPKEFKEELDALGDIDELRIFINSDGGDVFAGQAIYSMLKRHSARKVVYVDGLAASIASVIAMAGDMVRMPRNAMMVVHHPWSWGWGNAKQFRELADVLDKIAETIISVYQEKTGLARDEIVAIMDAETWITAEEAVEKGFADEIEEAKQVAASLRGDALIVNGRVFDVSRYRNRPSVPEAGESDQSIATPGRGGASTGQQDVAVVKLEGAVMGGDDLEGRITAAVKRTLSSREPPDERGARDDARKRKLKLMALELELLSGSSF